MVKDSLRELEFEAAEPLFYERIEKFAAAIARWGPRINLTAKPGDAAELAFHIVDSLAPVVLAERAEAGVIRDAFVGRRCVLDLGSGAGFPALILASASRADFTLLEARRKRASFLLLTAAEMGLHNVVVDSMHRDISAFKPAYDIVTARAFAKPAIVLRTVAAAMKPKGFAILYVSPDQRLNLNEVRAAGLFDQCMMRYEIRRGKGRVQRHLAIFHKT
jgi:16S rRNA (guanine(527)-N(7))-methyltransferase RsmG